MNWDGIERVRSALFVMALGVTVIVIASASVVALVLL
jgi:hypothetical protein